MNTLKKYAFWVLILIVLLAVFFSQDIPEKIAPITNETKQSPSFQTPADEDSIVVPTPNTVISSDEISGSPSPQIEQKRELTESELEELKSTDYHSYIRYKAQKDNAEVLSSTDKEQARERVKKRLLEHLEKKN